MRGGGAAVVVVVVVVVVVAAAGAEDGATAPAVELDSEDFAVFASPDGMGAGSTVGVT